MIFFPGYAQTFTQIGKERGWPPTTRGQFDALRGPTGALIIGDAETVAAKMLYEHQALGGVVRMTFQMGVSMMSHAKMMRAIEILGTKVAPIIRERTRRLSLLLLDPSSVRRAGPPCPSRLLCSRPQRSLVEGSAFFSSSRKHRFPGCN